MTVPAGPAPGAQHAPVCTLCGATLVPGADRCVSCGLVVTPTPAFSRSAVVAIGAAFVAVYAVAVVLVAAAR
jgi:hypothetical protein